MTVEQDVASHDQLRATALGDELSKQEAEILATKLKVRKLHDGDVLTAAGGKAHTLYVLVEGGLAVQSNIEGQDVTVYTMKMGECAGTRAFVDRTPRKASLRAVGETTVYALEPDDFETLLDSHPRIVYKVMRALFRITHTNLMRMNHESLELAKYITKTHGRY